MPIKINSISPFNQPSALVGHGRRPVHLNHNEILANLKLPEPFQASTSIFFVTSVSLIAGKVYKDKKGCVLLYFTISLCVNCTIFHFHSNQYHVSYKCKLIKKRFNSFEFFKASLMFEMLNLRFLKFSKPRGTSP